MEKLYLKEIEDAEYVYYLLKYLKKRSDELGDEYNNSIIKDVFNHNYIITGLFHKTKCKTCITNWEVNQVGLLYMHKNRRCLDMLEFNINIEYRDKEEVKDAIRKYLRSFFSREQLNYFEEIKIHSMLKPKEYYDEYFNTTFTEYNTYIWRV